MIGSSTLLVKSGSKYDVHTCGGMFIPELLKLDARRLHKSIYAMFNRSVCKWEKKGLLPEAVVSDEEAILIADATNCIGGEDYHKFAGDMVILLNRDTKKAYYRSNKSWAEF